MHRRILLFITICLLFTMLPLVASGADEPRLYIWDADLPYEQGGKPPHDAIQWYKRSPGHRYLFLPSGMDASNLRIYLTGAKSLTIGDQKLQNGDVTDLFVPGTSFKVKAGGRDYELFVMQSQNMATIHFRTESGTISRISKSKEIRESGSVSIYDEQGDLYYQDDFDYIRCRGNSSFKHEKKSFQLKLNEGESLFGMDKGKTWLLIANWKDNSMLRNPITLDLAAAVSDVYTPDYRFVNVYGNAHYYGVYLLTEKIQINNGRVSITDLEEATEAANEKDLSKYPIRGNRKCLPGASKYSSLPNNPEDITGGYLLSMVQSNRYHEDTCGFATSAGLPIILKSPEYASQEQMTYISGVVQSFENAIRAKDGIDPASGKHYTELADMDSMVNKYLVEEISKNADGNKNSFYLYKDSDLVDSKLYFGPLWDYDNAYGNWDAPSYKGVFLNPTGLYTATEDLEPYYWFPQLYQHDDFQQAVKKAYKERFRPCLEVLLGLREPGEATGDLMSLTAYEELLTPAAALNFSRWRTFNHVSLRVETGKDYPENIQYLRTFLTERMAYLDTLWLD